MIRRSSPPRRRSPLASGGPPKKKKRTPDEYARIYGSVARVLFVKSLRCCASGLYGNIECAHVGTGGMSRKADASQIVPLASELHRELHRTGRASFEKKWNVDLAAIAQATEAKWQAHTANVSDA